MTRSRILVLAAVAVFLVVKGWAAFTASDATLQTEGNLPAGVSNLAEYIGPLIFGTLVAAALALAMATPVAVGIALLRWQ